MAAQVLGAIAAAAVLLVIANGRAGVLAADGNFLAANGFGAEGSPDGYNLLAAAVTEVVLTFGFVMVILGATDTRAHPALAGVAIGLALTLIHLISIPVDNTSVNPARSIGPACSWGARGCARSGSSSWSPWWAVAWPGLAYPALFGDAARRGDNQRRPDARCPNTRDASLAAVPEGGAGQDGGDGDAGAVASGGDHVDQLAPEVVGRRRSVTRTWA